MKERYKLGVVLGVFAVCWLLPVERLGLPGALHESASLVRWYAREHVVLCLIPAFFIAGGISVFVRQGAVIKYLGADAKKTVAYPVAAISGTVLAVCSCTVLPLFASIYKRGAGLGPAAAFLYAGPAINVLAIILTARLLGFDLGIARAVGAVVFAVVIGVVLAALFRRDARDPLPPADLSAGAQDVPRALWQEVLFFAAMLGVLVFANWGAPPSGSSGVGVYASIHGTKWILAGASALGLAGMLLAWFDREELRTWVDASWTFAKQILPLLLGGVLVAGLLLGGPGGSERGLLPNSWVQASVGGNSLSANLFASGVGAFMYFATLTEVPILEGLLRSGMGSGPALALLLAGPALSLPSMLVIRTVLGTRKTLAFVGLVVLLSTGAGLLHGAITGPREVEDAATAMGGVTPPREPAQPRSAAIEVMGHHRISEKESGAR